LVFAELSATANYGSRRRCARQCASLRLRPLTRFVLHISLVVSVGIPLCSYGTSYRRVYALSTARPCARWCLRRLTRSVRRVVSMVTLGGGAFSYERGTTLLLSVKACQVHDLLVVLLVRSALTGLLILSTLHLPNSPVVEWANATSLQPSLGHVV
jgi:hypothetical protein